MGQEMSNSLIDLFSIFKVKPSMSTAQIELVLRAKQEEERRLGKEPCPILREAQNQLLCPSKRTRLYLALRSQGGRNTVTA